MEAPSEALLLVVTGEVNMKTFERKTCEKLNEVTKLMLMFSFYTDSLPAEVKVHSGTLGDDWSVRHEELGHLPDGFTPEGWIVGFNIQTPVEFSVV